MKLALALLSLTNAQQNQTADLIEFDKWSKPKVNFTKVPENPISTPFQEYQIIAAYDAQEEIVLSNPNPENENGIARKKAFLHWHNCNEGQKPDLPKNARDVVCQGNHCATICKQVRISI